jgi:hypothetical protein
VESGSPRALAPCDAELIVDGQSRGTIRIDAERMPGPGSAGRRAVETRAALDAAELRGRDCRLIHHGGR